MGYTLYIDESGDTGIAKVRSATSSGSSPHMTLGAVLVENADKENLLKVLNDIQNTIGRKELHCNTMKHFQKVYYAKTIAQQKIVCFGVISYKQTLGSYSQSIDHDNTKYFNKCAQYLLENVGEFLEEISINKDDLSVVFEEGHHRYGKFRKFFQICQRNPHHPRTRLLQNIDYKKITDAPKSSDLLLAIADLVAHAIFQIVNRIDRNYHLSETRYLKELHKRFYCNATDQNICPKGLKPIHSLDEIGLNEDDEILISQLKGDLLLPDK